MKIIFQENFLVNNVFGESPDILAASMGIGYSGFEVSITKYDKCIFLFRRNAFEMVYCLSLEHIFGIMHVGENCRGLNEDIL